MSPKKQQAKKLGAIGIVILVASTGAFFLGAFNGEVSQFWGVITELIFIPVSLYMIISSAITLGRKK